MNGISKEECFTRMDTVKGHLTMDKAYEAMNPGLTFDDFLTAQKELAWKEKVSVRDAMAFVDGERVFLQKVELARANAELSLRRELGMIIYEEFIESKDWVRVFGDWGEWSTMSPANATAVVEHEWNKKFPDAGVTYQHARIELQKLRYWETAPYAELSTVYNEFQKAKRDAKAEVAEKKRANKKQKVTFS